MRGASVKSLGPLIGLAAVYVFFMMWAGEPFYSNFNRVTVLTQSVIVTAGSAGDDAGHHLGVESTSASAP